MKKRFLTFIFTITAMLTCIFGLSACGTVEFKVNFVVDGEVYATLNTNGEEVIKMPENPTKDDYVFDGWFWDKDTWQTPFTANSLLDAPLSSDMSVYCKWKPNTIPVESVTLDKTEITLHENDVAYLTATVTPNNATDTSVVWESSDPSIATVSDGKVTALCMGFVTITATTKDGGKIATCTVEVIEDKITFNTLSVDGENVYGKVSNATTTFSFIREIAEHGNATYQVYKEITCETLIASKTIDLKIGDNTVYVLQTVGRDLKLYTVTVRRRPVYNVTFDANGGTAVQSQQVEEDSFATAPETTPERLGYTFEKWDYDFAEAITEDTIIGARWELVTYKVFYELNGGDNAESNPTTYTIEDNITLSAPLKTGYAGSWSENGKIEKGSTGDKTFIASWVADVTLSADGKTVTGLKNNVNNLIILNEYNGIKVTSIGVRAFSSCSSLTSVTIPNIGTITKTMKL